MLQKLHDHVEALIGVMDDEVLGAYRSEAIVIVLSNPFRKAWCVGLKIQVGTVAIHKFGSLCHAKDTVHDGDIADFRVKLVDYHLA